MEDARAIMRQSEDALRRVRGAQEAGDAVRMGVSLMSPGRFTLDRWPQVARFVDALARVRSEV